MSANINSDSIYESLAGRVLRAWVRKKIFVGSHFSNVGWALSVHT